MQTNYPGRFYPTACQALYCGEITCPTDCEHLEALIEFQNWRKRTNAIQPDPVWSPTYWMATQLEA